jgi:ATP-dependent DNA helicase RecQ
VEHDEKVRTALRMVLAGVARAQSRVRCGKNLIAQMLCGSASSRLARLGFDRLSTFDALIATGHLEQVDLEPNRPVVQLTPSGTELMKAEGEVEVDVPIPAVLLAKLRGEPVGGEPARAARSAAGEGFLESLPPADQAVLESLRRWCTATALASGLPPHYVLTRATMDELARRRPKSREALLEVKGIGHAKLDRFGDALLAILAGGPAPESSATADSPGSADPTRGRGEGETRGRGDGEKGDGAWSAISGLPGSADGGPDDGLDSFGLANEAPPGVGSTPPATPVGENDRVRPDHFWTWRLVTAGFSAAECEVIRGVGREVIIDHLSRAIDEGWPVRPAVCFSPQLLTALEQVIGPGRPRQLRPLLADLPEGTRYEEVELFLKCRGVGS